MELIDNWRKLHKHASVVISAIGAAILGLIGSFPVDAYALWMNVPDQVKAVIPAERLPLIGAIIFIAAIVARAIKQSKLYEDAINDKPSN